MLGDIDAPGVDLQVIIRKRRINDAHGDAAVAEATRLGSVVKPKDIDGRTDFRAVPTVTIDGEDARDFDDAITLERLPNGHYRLGVHIADVSHYVREERARQGGLRARHLGLLSRARRAHVPARAVDGLCSLNLQVDRLVQSCLMEVNAKGDVVRYELHDGVIYSDERMTYTAVDAILTQKDSDTRKQYAPLVPLFELMGELFEVLNARRRRRAARFPDFDLPENEPVLDEAGRVSAVLASERNVAHRLIEEFMLLANETVAQHLSDHGTPALFRIHEAPDVLKVEEFEEFISSLGHSLAVPAHSVQPKHFQKLVKAIEACRRSAIAMLMLRTMQKALRRRQRRALRPRREELLPLHVADPPLSGPGRAPLRRQRAAAGAAHRGAGARVGGRAARSGALHVRPRAPGRRGRARDRPVEEGPFPWPTRSARSSRAT